MKVSGRYPVVRFGWLDQILKQALDELKQMIEIKSEGWKPNWTNGHDQRTQIRRIGTWGKAGMVETCKIAKGSSY